MILLETELVRVGFDESIPSISWVPLAFMSSEQFKEPFTQGMDFFLEKIKELPNLTWLNDARKLKSVKPEDVKWLDESVNNRA